MVSKDEPESTPTSTTHTIRYGADATETKSKPSTETAREFAERGIVQRHGEAIRNNPQFDAMVEEEQRQIEANREATKGQ